MPRRFDDDDEPRPRCRRTNRRGPAVHPLVWVGVGLGVCLLAIVMAGVVGYRLVRDLGGPSALPNRGGRPAGPQVAVTGADTDLFNRLQFGQSPTEVLLIAPGARKLPREEWKQARWPKTLWEPNGPSVSLGDMQPQYINATVASWYQWGAGDPRVFAGFGPDRRGRDVLVTKLFVSSGSVISTESTDPQFSKPVRPTAKSTAR